MLNRLQISVSGLELRNQPAEIGEALSDDFDGKVLNPSGVEIDLPFWVFKQLKKLHLLERDSETGKRRIGSFPLFLLHTVCCGKQFPQQGIVFLNVSLS
jgi:hypothetical protein